jgi:hypothetical protein
MLGCRAATALTGVLREDTQGDDDGTHPTSITADAEMQCVVTPVDSCGSIIDGPAHATPPQR